MPGQTRSETETTKLDWSGLAEESKLRAGQRQEGQEGKRKVPLQAQARKLRPCCPRGNGASRSHRETWEKN